MQCKEQWPTPGFDMSEVILLVPQPLQRPDRAPVPLGAANSLQPTGLAVWGAGRRAMLEQPCLPNLLFHKGGHSSTPHILWEEHMFLWIGRYRNFGELLMERLLKNFYLLINDFFYFD